jgi:hypothetical protein
MVKLKNYSIPNPTSKCIMHLPYSPNLMPPLTMMHSAQHNKLMTTKPSYPQAHESTTGSKKNAQFQRIKQTLRWLCKSDKLFFENSITQAKYEPTAISKNNTSNAKHVAINSAHAQRYQSTIGLAQCGQNTAHRLGSAFNQTIKKLNKNKHVSFVEQSKVHLFNATLTPSIMLTYNSGANRHYISKNDQRKAGLPILRPSTRQVGVANGGTSNATYITQLPC